ncbi:MAG: chemotaxis-specific protein-glutamate methyltransferase CheB [Thermoanaerobaculia bacterium]|jgi:two-component system chemotaxis response regulator CheB
MPIRVLIVDDSPTIREHLARIVMSDPRLEVAGVAADGREAIDLAERLAPDVITMDLHMPRVNGVEATVQIMASSPRPIVVISTSMDMNETALGFRALAAGALEILEKPQGLTADGYEKLRKRINDTLVLMAEVKVVKRWGGGGSSRQIATRASGRKDRSPVEPRAIGICSSTGGPPALHLILSELDPGIDVPVFVVQHMAVGFTPGLVSWLSNGSKLEVAIAEDGVVARRGHAYIAPDDRHLLLRDGGTMSLSDALPVRHHRPSGDWLFRSLAASYGTGAVGVILTGMGSDGCDGMREVHAAGGYVLAQDEASCAIFSMPKAVIDEGIASEVLPLGEIPGRLNALLLSRKEPVGGKSA